MKSLWSMESTICANQQGILTFLEVAKSRRREGSPLIGGDSVATTAVYPRPYCWERTLFLSFEDSSIRVGSY